MGCYSISLPYGDHRILDVGDTRTPRNRDKHGFMIDRAMTLVAHRLNAHLRAVFGLSEDVVALSPLVDGEGKTPETARNRLVLFISNIAQDATARGASRAPISLAGQMRRAAPVHLDIYFILAASFDPEKYAEGLKLLTAGMRYFQANANLTPSTHPEMAPNLNQLSIDIANLGSDSLGQLWGNFGGAYAPSIQYKMRSVVIDSDAVIAIDPIVREADVQSAPVPG